MTTPSMPAMHPSTPRREAIRAALASAAAFAGGALFVLGQSASASPPGPLAAFAAPSPSIAPASWALEPAALGGWAAMPQRLAASGLATPLMAIGALLLAIGALVVIHPGAFARPAPYYLPPFRRAVAFASALLIGLALPATAGRLEVAFGAIRPFVPDAGLLVRLLLGVAVFCAILWTLAGRGVFNPRGLFRFSHGGIAGAGIWGGLSFGVLFAAPLSDVARLSGMGAAALRLDAAQGSPGHTHAWLLTSTMLAYGLSMALASAVAVVGAPQSVGQRARSGAVAVAGTVLALMLLAGWRMGAGARERTEALAPDLVALYGLETLARPRAVILLAGESAAGVRVHPRIAMTPVALADDCAPALPHAERALPAASRGNVQRLERALEEAAAGSSALPARVHSCLVSLRARLFEPAEARRLIFDDPVPGRVGPASLTLGARSLSEYPSMAGHRAYLVSLGDSARYAVAGEGRAAFARLASESAAGPGVELVGRLAAPVPAEWRVGLVRGVDTADAHRAAAYAPRTDGAALQFLAMATSPVEDGTFRLSAIPPGRYQLALLAPPGIGPGMLGGLSIRGDPGQLVLSPAAPRRDLGTIVITF